ncbi:hypothetical protein [Streptomyces sp. NPDC047070]|uniref:hypothetical protein n=1 Tax=Streptomyces sp. NPDC047070 TaxID=3154923 RepID=UPI0034524162
MVLALLIPDDGTELALLGLSLVIAATPVLVMTHQRKSIELTEDERAALRTEGYRVALYHLAAGMLNTTDPDDPIPGEPQGRIVEFPKKHPHDPDDVTDIGREA